MAKERDESFPIGSGVLKLNPTVVNSGSARLLMGAAGIAWPTL